MLTPRVAMTQGDTDKLSSGRELMGNIELETATVGRSDLKTPL